MAIASYRPYLKPLIHILIWMLLGIMLLLFHPLSWQVTLPPEFWVKQGVLFCLLVMVFYLNSEVLVPLLLFRNKTGWFVMVLVGISLALMILVQMVDLWLNLPELMYRAFRPEGGDPPPLTSSHWFNTYLLLISFLVLGISTSVSAIQKWQKDVQIRQELEQQRVSTELLFLKAQINPHFFFNTLNNIYSLTHSNVVLARKALHKLSRMMRYVLYETQKDAALLSQETAFLQDYIELMQLRLSDKTTICFEKPEDLKDILIAPMLFLPFVENAFKHGVSALQPSQVFISIQQKQGQLQLTVRNPIFTRQGLVLEESNGIGLVNTRRRLDLLYPGKYMLKVNEDGSEKEFLVQLTLQVP